MGSWQSKSDNTSEMDNTKETMESDEEYFHDAVDEPNAKENNLKNFQTDAVKSKHPNIVNPKITLETIRDIESELTFYEKVSLAFLLFDQEDIALQWLLVEKENLRQSTTTNFLFNWAQSEKSKSWKQKCIEGLSIIQNYSILERLGYNKEYIKASHIPTSPYTSSYINISSKALYCFAESLTIDQIRSFLKLLENDFQKKGMKFIKFDDIFVEMYLLQCFSVKYIEKNDIANLIAILKKLDLSQQIEMLETAIRAPRGNTNSEISDEDCATEQIKKVNDCVFDLNTTFNNNGNINAVTPGSCSEHSVISRSSLVETCSSGCRYVIDPNNVGICLIINQHKFYEDTNHPNSILIPEARLEDRNGTQFDRDVLKETFEKFNFRIMIEENLTDSQIIKAIKDAMYRFSSKDSCFIVCILSHGEKDSVFGVNSIPVYISELEDALHDTRYTALLGKPKILIIQSCQGKPLQQVVSFEHNYVTDGVSSMNSVVLQNALQGVPQRRDLLLLMSTVSGFASVRDPTKGTWFIQEFCNVLEEESDNSHLEDIMTTVIRKVSDKRWPKNNKILTMVPEKKTTFSKQLFLRKVQK